MTKKDFLVLVIKLFGLYAAISSLFSVIPRMVSFTILRADMTLVILMIGFSVCFLSWYLIFHAEKLVEILKLNKGFADDRIELTNLQASDLYKIAVLLIGAYLFISSVAQLISDAYWLIELSNKGNELSPANKIDLSVAALNLLIGYLLFTNYDVVANYFDRKNDNSAIK